MEANKPFHLPHAMTKNLTTVSYTITCHVDIFKPG